MTKTVHCDSLTAKVDQLFAEWAKPDSPGAALVVVKDGALVYQCGYGSANLEYNIPITPSTVFHVASVSKQFTAFVIAMLAQGGKLSLDDDIHTYLPEVPDFGKTITIRHLIYHTSGLRDQWELLLMAGWRLDDVITKEHILKMVRHQQELNFAPGAEHLYCNTGYTLLAEIVERIMGQSFRAYTEATLFTPLGMTNTHFHDDHELIVRNRAYAYAPDEGAGFRKSVLSYATVGATSLFTTVEDLTKWLQNFEDGHVGGPAVIEQMYEQGRLNNGEKISYAFGLETGTHKGLRTVSHSGTDAGYRSHLVRFPDRHFAVAILSNLGTWRPMRHPAYLARQVADLYLSDDIGAEKPKAEPQEQSVAKADPAAHDVYVGKYHLPAGVAFPITKENDRLMVKLPWAPKLVLCPEAETRFFLKDLGVHLSFTCDETGKVLHLTIHWDGESITAKRIALRPLTTDQLAQFVGNYYSEELGTTYSIVIQDGQLVARHRRHEDVSLTPIVEDRFAGDRWRFGEVRFIRDDETHVTGFRLSSGRVRNVRFAKQAC